MSNVDIVRSKLKDQVPLIQHMGVDIVEYRPGYVMVEAPLEPNINTHGTAFGGSLYCVATMSGWSLVHLTLMDAGFEPSVWVTKGEVAYHKPVKGPLKAFVKASPTQCQALVDEYKAKGRARADLDIEVHHDDELALTLKATFAAR